MKAKGNLPLQLYMLHTPTLDLTQWLAMHAKTAQHGDGREWPGADTTILSVPVGYAEAFFNGMIPRRMQSKNGKDKKKNSSDKSANSSDAENSVHVDGDNSSSTSRKRRGPKGVERILRQKRH
eukprot:GHVO01039365.1.p1 GENE.GHVO01039365.1~~GHVO01039365.1.p1  ORF type:complete len:123 (+),score=22.02 GHVO01039365.1:150-518(+)